MNSIGMLEPPGTRDPNLDMPMPDGSAMLSAQLFRYAEDLVKLGDRNRALGRKLLEVFQELPGLRARSALFDALLTGSDCLHLITDQTGRILAAGGSAQLLGPPEALPQLHLHDLACPDQYPFIDAVLHEPSRTEPVPRPYLVVLHPPGDPATRVVCCAMHLTEATEGDPARLHWMLRLPPADAA